MGVLQECHGKRCAVGYAACAAPHPGAGGTGRRTTGLRERASTQESGGGAHGLLRARDVSASLRRVSNHCRSANGAREIRSCCRQGGCGNLARDRAAGRAVSLAALPCSCQVVGNGRWCMNPWSSGLGASLLSSYPNTRPRPKPLSRVDLRVLAFRHESRVLPAAGAARGSRRLAESPPAGRDRVFGRGRFLPAPGIDTTPFDAHHLRIVGQCAAPAGGVQPRRTAVSRDPPEAWWYRGRDSNSYSR